MCEKCPRLSASKPFDPEACRLAGELISRSQELLPPSLSAEDHARWMLIQSHTYTRNALISHTGGARQSELMRATAHIAATEIRAQAETLLRKAGLPDHYLMRALQGVTDQFTEHLARSLAQMSAPIDGFLVTPPAPRKAAS